MDDPAVAGGRAHWDDVYATRPNDAVSWYERDPAISRRLIAATTPDHENAIVDIGAGASTLVDHLVASGYADVTVLDVSPLALDKVRCRLGDAAHRVTFVIDDIRTWVPVREYDTWHDRAVFHFLTEQNDRDHYVAAASRAVRAGGALIVATFAPDGPTQCSGLPVCGYTADALATMFTSGFTLVTSEREEHCTPTGAVQPFTWVVLRRRDGGDD